MLVHLIIHRSKNKETLVFHGVQVNIICDLHVTSKCSNTCTTSVEHTRYGLGFLMFYVLNKIYLKIEGFPYLLVLCIFAAEENGHAVLSK